MFALLLVQYAMKCPTKFLRHLLPCDLQYEATCPGLAHNDCFLKSLLRDIREFSFVIFLRQCLGYGFNPILRYQVH